MRHASPFHLGGSPKLGTISRNSMQRKRPQTRTPEPAFLQTQNAKTQRAVGRGMEHEAKTRWVTEESEGGRKGRRREEKTAV